MLAFHTIIDDATYTLLINGYGCFYEAKFAFRFLNIPHLIEDYAVIYHPNSFQL